jgi:hypothetical protein
MFFFKDKFSQEYSKIFGSCIVPYLTSFPSIKQDNALHLYFSADRHVVHRVFTVLSGSKSFTGKAV